MNVALLTGSVKGKKRQLLLEQLAQGTIDCVIGTHALIQEDVQFNNIGLVITDEQHRFGVNQRQLLREKGAMTNVLFMTATPIPRTLAISVLERWTYPLLNSCLKDESLLKQAGRNTSNTNKYYIK